MPEETSLKQAVQSEPKTAVPKQVRRKKEEQDGRILNESPLGKVSVLEEFLYPDDCIGALPKELRLVTAKNAKPGLQFMIGTTGGAMTVSLAEEKNSLSAQETQEAGQPDFSAELYEMIDVPVEYNTGDGVQQGGAMVLENRPQTKPPYVTRLAPFRVYDCLKLCKTWRIPAFPVDKTVRKASSDTEKMHQRMFSTSDSDEPGSVEIPSSGGEIASGEIPAFGDEIVSCEIPASGGRAASYLCIDVPRDMCAGEYFFRLHVHVDEGDWECRLTLKVCDTEIPEDTFPVTNWFSEEAICRFHGMKQGTESYFSMVRKYAKAMRRMHQNTIFVQLDPRCVVSQEEQKFDFEYLTPLIECFFEEGMQELELGYLLHRGYRKDGTPDMYTASFRCAMHTELLFDTLEGYAYTVRLVKSLAAYLQKHGWEKRVIFHIHDEPDIHYKDDETLAARRRQYYLASSILRKYLPQIRIIEAVDSPAFFGGIDIWVSGTAGYEAKKQEFDRLIALGETVWSYVCCGPEGDWLNRFLDFHLLRGRLLFWGFAKNRISGFLHWGFNQFPCGMDPFEGTSCPNDTGIGTNFPCGDSFLVYPAEDGPMIGMRLEAQRRGAEDAMLWQQLRKKDERLHDELLSEVFTNNHEYCNDPEKFMQVYEKLLAALE